MISRDALLPAWSLTVDGIAGSVMVNFLVVGCCVRSFGVFFHIIQERFHASAAEISWIPALVGCVALLSGKIDGH